MEFLVSAGSHLANFGGGFKAVYWHTKALLELGHRVTIAVSMPVHPRIFPYFSGVSIRWYKHGMEAQFEGALTVDHFRYGQPLAKVFNGQHIFFPALPQEPPAEMVLSSNSRYTADHIEYRFGRKASVMYIPIDEHYKVGRKEKMILHVSRFAEPNEWADKAHRQMIYATRYLQASLPDWKLVMVGAVEQGQNSYVDSLMQIAGGLNVDFLFDPSDEQMADLYSRAAIYWHATGISLPNIPSAQEHLGLAPLEAQASGCVPIVFNSGGMPEVVLANRTGLLFDDIRQMAQFTADLANRMDLWSAYMQHGVYWAAAWKDFNAFKVRLAQWIAGEPVDDLPNTIPQLQYRQSDVTIVIPTWNNEEILQRCLISLNATAPGAKVLVMNNGDKLKIVPPEGVEVYDCGENLGFAGAYRKAEGMVDTPLVLLMNDDVEARNKNWLEMMMLPMSSKEVGVVGAKLLFPNGALQHAGGVVDFGREDIGYHRWYGERDNFDASMPCVVDFVTGACMMVRKELFHFDKMYADTLNMEDVDLCFSAKEKGYKVFYQPAASLIHHEGVSKKRNPDTEAKVAEAREIFRARWQK